MRSRCSARATSSRCTEEVSSSRSAGSDADPCAQLGRARRRSPLWACSAAARSVGGGEHELRRAARAPPHRPRTRRARAGGARPARPALHRVPHGLRARPPRPAPAARPGRRWPARAPRSCAPPAVPRPRPAGLPRPPAAASSRASGSGSASIGRIGAGPLHPGGRGPPAWPRSSASACSEATSDAFDPLRLPASRTGLLAEAAQLLGDRSHPRVGLVEPVEGQVRGPRRPPRRAVRCAASSNRSRSASWTVAASSDSAFSSVGRHLDAPGCRARAAHDQARARPRSPARVTTSSPGTARARLERLGHVTLDDADPIEQGAEGARRRGPRRRRRRSTAYRAPSGRLGQARAVRGRQLRDEHGCPAAVVGRQPGRARPAPRPGPRPAPRPRPHRGPPRSPPRSRARPAASPRAVPDTPGTAPSASAPEASATATIGARASTRAARPARVRSTWDSSAPQLGDPLVDRAERAPEPTRTPSRGRARPRRGRRWTTRGRGTPGRLGWPARGRPGPATRRRSISLARASARDRAALT